MKFMKMAFLRKKMLTALPWICLILDTSSVVSYEPNLTPQLIITTPEIYRDTYDFAVIDYQHSKLRLDESLIEKINGKPYTKIHCSNKLAVVVYGKNKLSVK